jgi:hypothetical protein
MAFVKAERKRGRARIGLVGPAGAGKTHSALLLSAGLADGGKIAIIDTEHHSAELEAGKPGIPEYDVMTLDPPFDTVRFSNAIAEAEKEGYTVLIIDSLTAPWSGKGGLLEQHQMLCERGTNSFAAWSKITPKQEALVNSILSSNMHVICTMRAKTEYVLETNEKGKSSPRKVGLAPQQRDNLEFEFTVVFEIDQKTNTAVCSKDRTSLFQGMSPVRLSKDTGEQIRSWLDAGANSAPQAQVKEVKSDSRKLSDAERNKLLLLARNAGFDSLDTAIAKCNMDIDAGSLTLANAKELAAILREKTEQ